MPDAPRVVGADGRGVLCLVSEATMQMHSGSRLCLRSIYRCTARSTLCVCPQHVYSPFAPPEPGHLRPSSSSTWLQYWTLPHGPHFSCSQLKRKHARVLRISLLPTVDRFSRTHRGHSQPSLPPHCPPPPYLYRGTSLIRNTPPPLGPS